LTQQGVREPEGRQRSCPSHEELGRLVLREVGLEQGTIRIKRFFVPGCHIGIADFPEFFEDVLRRPLEYTEDDRAIANSELKRWSNDGIFILWLSEHSNIWLNQYGEV
jgi:hypothetical protein